MSVCEMEESHHGGSAVIAVTYYEKDEGTTTKKHRNKEISQSYHSRQRSPSMLSCRLPKDIGQGNSGRQLRSKNDLDFAVCWKHPVQYLWADGNSTLVTSALNYNCPSSLHSPLLLYKNAGMLTATTEFVLRSSLCYLRKGD